MSAMAVDTPVKDTSGGGGSGGGGGASGQEKTLKVHPVRYFQLKQKNLFFALNPFMGGKLLDMLHRSSNESHTLLFHRVVLIHILSTSTKNKKACHHRHI
mmetsp:Transcript_32472/g.49148  ORF Transcript_32472/g.49148 Transcript_32472/m.49148 type:complete len:100 (+) Transcript_32472:178-477(+)